MDLEYYILSNLKTNEIINKNFEITEQNVERVTKDKVAEYESINQRIVAFLIKPFILHNIINSFYFLLYRKTSKRKQLKNL